AISLCCHVSTLTWQHARTVATGRDRGDPRGRRARRGGSPAPPGCLRRRRGTGGRPGRACPRVWGGWRAADPPRRPRRRAHRTRTARPRSRRGGGRVPASLQASGGIRSLDDARSLLAAGADRVVVGTAAFPDPAPWAELGERLVVALDVGDGQVRTAGWTEGSGLSIDAAAERCRDAGVTRVLCTAIERDG